MRVSVFPYSPYACQYPKRLKESLTSCAAKAINGCEPRFAFWKSNLGRLKEKLGPLTAEPSMTPSSASISLYKLYFTYLALLFTFQHKNQAQQFCCHIFLSPLTFVYQNKVDVCSQVHRLSLVYTQTHPLSPRRLKQNKSFV